jgi:hypothetical protein
MFREILNYIPGLVIKKKHNVNPSTVVGFVFKPMVENNKMSMMHFIDERNFSTPANACTTYLHHLKNVDYYASELKSILNLSSDFEISYHNDDNKHILMFSIDKNDSGVRIISFDENANIRSDFNISNFALIQFFHYKQIDIYNLLKTYNNIVSYE